MQCLSIFFYSVCAIALLVLLIMNQLAQSSALFIYLTLLDKKAGTKQTKGSVFCFCLNKVFFCGYTSLLSKFDLDMLLRTTFPGDRAYILIKHDCIPSITHSSTTNMFLTSFSPWGPLPRYLSLHKVHRLLSGRQKAFTSNVPDKKKKKGHV